MSKEQSLRNEIKATVEIIKNDPEKYSIVILAETIMQAIDSRLPKEKPDNSFDEDYINGYNEAISDVRKELGL